MMQNSSENTQNKTENVSENSENFENSDDIENSIDFGKIMQILSMLNSEENSKDTALLLALKPHLKEEKQEKIDKIIKIMKILNILKTANNSGLLGDFIKF